MCPHPLHSPGAVTNPGLLELPSLAPASILRQGDTGGGGAGAASTLTSTQSQYMEVTWLPYDPTSTDCAPVPGVPPPEARCRDQLALLRLLARGEHLQCGHIALGLGTAPRYQEHCRVGGFHQSTCRFRVSEYFFTFLS